jgi:Family of unknown function (DUF6496)
MSKPAKSLHANNLFDNRKALAQFRYNVAASRPLRSVSSAVTRNLLHMQGLSLRVQRFGEIRMAKRRKRKYSRGAGSDVKREMHRYKRGTARSGRGGRGGRVKSRKQAIAIGLSKARKKGKKVPKKRA